MNINRPQKGDCIKVEPVKTLEDIANIKKHLTKNPRDLAIWTLGTNTNLRASDIVALTVGQLKHLKGGDDLLLKEKKTGKHRHITINKTVHDTIQKLISTMPGVKDTSPLFQSRKGGKALTPGMVEISFCMVSCTV